MSAMMTAEAASQERIAPIEDCNFILQITVGCGILFKEHTAVISHMEGQRNVCILISLINVPFRAKVCQLYTGGWKFLRAEAWMR